MNTFEKNSLPIRWATRWATRWAIALVLASSAPLASAATCKLEILRGAVTGICDLSAVIARDVVVPFQFARAYSPDLVPHGMRYAFGRNEQNRYEVQASIGVDNITANAAGPFYVDVAVTVTGRSTANGQMLTLNLMPGLTERSSGLPGGNSQDIGFLRRFVLADFDPNYDIDITAMMSIDAPTSTMPIGEVKELRETNNTLTKTCRIYGLVMHDPSVRHCN